MNIGVFFGSRSPEHDVSIVTGELIISGLKKLGHTVIPVYIDKKGRWLIGEELGSIRVFTENRVDKVKGVGEYAIDLENSHGKLVFRKKGAFGKEVTVDLAFPAFHGSFGEDGTIQGLFEMFDVPYVGCDTTCSAVTMDKVLTKLCFHSYG
ncbi:MAG: D-alanine--D-alanine ligase, partial [Patescibacteria group bacterium]